jgi:hypothetical protein
MSYAPADISYAFAEIVTPRSGLAIQQWADSHRPRTEFNDAKPCEEEHELAPSGVTGTPGANGGRPVLERDVDPRHAKRVGVDAAGVERELDLRGLARLACGIHRGALSETRAERHRHLPLATPFLDGCTRSCCVMASRCPRRSRRSTIAPSSFAPTSRARPLRLRPERTHRPLRFRRFPSRLGTSPSTWPTRNIGGHPSPSRRPTMSPGLESRTTMRSSNARERPPCSTQEPSPTNTRARRMESVSKAARPRTNGTSRHPTSRPVTGSRSP